MKRKGDISGFFLLRSTNEAQLRSRQTPAPMSAALAALKLQLVRQVSVVRHKDPVYQPQVRAYRGSKLHAQLGHWAVWPHSVTIDDFDRLRLFMNVDSACNNRWLCVWCYFIAVLFILTPSVFFTMQFPQLLRVTHTSASEEEDSEPELLGGDATEPPHPHQAPHSVHLKDQVVGPHLLTYLWTFWTAAILTWYSLANTGATNGIN